MKKKIISFCLLISFGIPVACAQQIRIDSLRKVLSVSKNDTNKINTLLALSLELQNAGDEKQALSFSEQGFSESKKINYYKGQVESLKRKLYMLGGKATSRDSALQAVNLLMQLGKSKKDTLTLLKAHQAEGRIYFVCNNFTKSYECYHTALKLAEALNLQKEMALCYRQMGVAYVSVGGKKYNEEGLEYYNRALKIFETLHDTDRIAGMYYVMGIAYNNLEYFEKGKMCQEELIKFCEKLGDDACVARAQNEIVSYYFKERKFDKAIETLMDSYSRLKKKKGNEQDIATTCGKIIPCLFELGRIDDALPYINESLVIGLETKNIAIESTAYTNFYRYYSKKGNHKEALKYFEKSVLLNTKLQETERTKEMNEMKGKYETEQRDKKIQLLNKDNDVKTAEGKKQKLLLFFITAIAIVVLIVTVVIFRTLRVTQKQKRIITKQKEIVESQQNIKLLSAVGQQITSCLSVEKIIELTYENVNKLMDASTFCIGTYNDNENRLEFFGDMEKGEKLAFNYEMLDTERLSVFCFKNQQEIIMNDYANDYSNYFPGKQVPVPTAGETVESLIYIPLTFQDKKLGVITVQSFAKNSYSNYHIDMLRNLAIYVSIALENALVYQRIEQKVKERTAEVEMQKSEIEEKNKDIIASITYAKRIQTSLLPTEKYIDKNLKRLKK